MPLVIPVTVEFRDEGVVIVHDGPENLLHTPAPGEGSLPAIVAVVVPDARHWLAPAFD